MTPEETGSWVIGTESEDSAEESGFSELLEDINSILRGLVDQDTLEQIEDLVSDAWTDRTIEPEPAEDQTESHHHPEGVHGTEPRGLQRFQVGLGNLYAALNWNTIKKMMVDGEMEAEKLGATTLKASLTSIHSLLDQEKTHFESHLEEVKKAFAALEVEMQRERDSASSYRKILEVQLAELEDLAMERLVLLNRVQTERHKLQTTEHDLVNALNSIADLKIKLAKVNRHAVWLHGTLCMAHSMLEELFESFSGQIIPILEYNSDPKAYHEFVEGAILDEAFKFVTLLNGKLKKAEDCRMRLEWRCRQLESERQKNRLGYLLNSVLF